MLAISFVRVRQRPLSSVTVSRFGLPLSTFYGSEGVWCLLQSVSREISTQPDDEAETMEERVLEELGHLTNLTALNLSENYFLRIPLQLSLLTNLEYLDLSANEYLQVFYPLLALNPWLLESRVINLSCKWLATVQSCSSRYSSVCGLYASSGLCIDISAQYILTATQS